MRYHWLAFTSLLLAATAWGASFVLIKEILASVTPERFMFWRFLVGGSALLVVSLVGRQLPLAVIGPGAGLGLLVFGGYWLQTRGLLEISPSRSAFLTGLAVVMVPLFDRVIYRVNISPLKITSTLVATLGTFLLMGGIHGRITTGDGMTIACAVLFAIHIVVAARLSRGHPPLGLAAIQVLMVAVISGPIVAYVGSAPMSKTVVQVIVLTGLFTTALTFYVMMWAQSKLSATETAVVLAFEPVAAAITSLVTGHDRLTLNASVGSLMILGAMILSQIEGRGSSGIPLHE